MSVSFKVFQRKSALGWSAIPYSALARPWIPSPRQICFQNIQTFCFFSCSKYTDIVILLCFLLSSYMYAKAPSQSETYSDKKKKNTQRLNSLVTGEPVLEESRLFKESHRLTQPNPRVASTASHVVVQTTFIPKLITQEDPVQAHSYEPLMWLQAEGLLAGSLLRQLLDHVPSPCDYPMTSQFLSPQSSLTTRSCPETRDRQKKRGVNFFIPNLRSNALSSQLSSQSSCHQIQLTREKSSEEHKNDFAFILLKSPERGQRDSSEIKSTG